VARATLPAAELYDSALVRERVDVSIIFKCIKARRSPKPPPLGRMGRIEARLEREKRDPLIRGGR